RRSAKGHLPHQSPHHWGAAMTNKWLAKLHGLERGTGADIFKTRHPQEPSKPSKPSFEGFKGEQGWRISENRDDHTTAEPCANSTAENEKRGTLTDPQNLQNLRTSLGPDRTKVTIVEIPASGLRYRRTYAHLQLRPPAHIPEDRWQQAIADGRAFLHQWGETAQRLRWTSADPFRFAPIPDKPHPSYRRLSRYDATGLVWLLEGRPVVALTEATAAIENVATGSITVYRKHNRPAYGPLGDSLDDFNPEQEKTYEP